MAMRVKKLMVKLFDEDDGKVKWLHVCYIGSKLYDTFLEEKHIDSIQFADFIADWFNKDFGQHITMTTKRDLNILKGVVKERYRVIFPAIYNNTEIDSQGWVRVWLSEKMEGELKNDDKRRF